MNETQALLAVLALADIEIESGETTPIEEVMKEFSVEAPKKPESNLKLNTVKNYTDVRACVSLLP